MKTFTMAVVGPEDSVKLITNVVTANKGQLCPLPIVYQTASDVPDIIKKYDDQVDMWLFSGKVPYAYANQADCTQKPLYYIPHVGSSLYRVLVQIAHIQKMPIERISFDSFFHNEIEETFKDISAQLPTFYLFDYEGTISADRITQYHYNLWQEKKIDFAVTSFLASYLNLKKLGVPAFRIYPTRDTIRTVLKIATTDATALQFKGGQIAIQHIAIHKYAEFLRDIGSTYAAKRIEIKLYDLLMHYTESIKGSIIMHSNGQYTIYSTRGIIEDLTQGFTTMPLLDEITRTLSIHVNGGIGFGSTAYDADTNAHMALRLAENVAGSAWMTILDDKTVCGPLSSETYLQYGIQSHDDTAHFLANKLNISITTANRLFAAFHKLDNAKITATDLAPYLNITTRTARRLLSCMENIGFADYCGEEGFGQGRPRKAYSIRVNSILEKIK